MSTAKTPKTRRQKTVLLVETAMLAAIVVVMTLTPLGYLRVGPLELTLIMVPVIIGAVTCGPTVGAVLGGVFGITSFVQCFMGSPLGAILVSLSIPKTFVICVVTRVLAGWLCGLIFRACISHDKKGSWSYVVAGLFTNKYFATVITLFFGFLLCLGGYNNIWPLFGAANQLLASLVLIALSVFLLTTGRKGWMLYAPMCIMLVVTFTA